MKYFKRAGIYKNSTGKAKFNPKTMEATSYGWWMFVRKIRGRVVFNAYHYSNTTSKHQSNVRAVLRQLGIEYITVSVSVSLDKFPSLSAIKAFQIEEQARHRAWAKERRRQAYARRKARLAEEKARELVQEKRAAFVVVQGGAAL